MLGAGSIHTRSERALWAAVLVNALFDLLDGFEFIDRGTIHRESSRDWRNSGRQKRQREAEAVRYWLNRESRDPGGYGFVAEALDIDADRLRRRIFEIATDDELRDYVLGNTGGHQKAKRARLFVLLGVKEEIHAL